MYLINKLLIGHGHTWHEIHKQVYRYCSSQQGHLSPSKIYISGGELEKIMLWKRHDLAKALKFFQALATPIGGIHAFHTTGTQKHWKEDAGEDD